MTKKKKEFKDRVGVVYSTDPDFEFQLDIPQEQETLDPSSQNLRVFLDTKLKAGKKATIVSGFVGTSLDLKTLEKKLKAHCGVGGSSKQGEIIIQGDVRSKVLKKLESEGYKTRMS